MKKNKGLYIHIPFCSQLCSYCDFTKMFYKKSLVSKYLLELKKELESYKIKDITSIYIGGGTPSSLEEDELEYLLKIVEPFYQEGMYYTIEANIENLTLNKIHLLKKYHINRVSLGVQTLKREILEIINRNHTKEQVLEVVNNLKQNGISDINIDLIYGLPNQTLEDIKNDLDYVLTLPITHISTYSLMINKNTKMYLDGYKEKDEDTIREMYDYIVDLLKKYGFHRYEVSNFAKENYESKHNLIYWRNEEYYGIGLGASGYIDGIRYTNTKSINKYLKGERIFEKEFVSEKDKEFYRVMLGLRLEEGIENKNLNEEKVNSLINRGLLVKNKNRIKVNEKDLFILDYIVRELM